MADEDDETTEVRKAALEFMVSLSEARPGMVRRVDGWTAAVVRACLEGMGEIPEEDAEIWLEADVCSSSSQLKTSLFVLTVRFASQQMTQRTTHTHISMNRR